MILSKCIQTYIENLNLLRKFKKNNIVDAAQRDEDKKSNIDLKKFETMMMTDLNEQIDNLKTQRLNFKITMYHQNC